jgi:glycosyltransferase involved in cell wall biosynthesis
VTPVSRLVLVVPCFDEERRLAPAAFLDALSRPHLSLLFVDDGSRDGTAAVLERLRAAAPHRVSVLHLPANRGKAEAVRRGLLAAFDAGATLAGYWDADLSTPFSELDGFVDALEATPSIDLVMGSRVQTLGRTIVRRAVRHYPGRVFATAASLALGLPIYDTQCGAKLLRVTPATRALFETPFVSGWAFDVEVLARLIRQRGSRAAAAAAIEERPLREWRHVPGSKVHARHLAGALWDVWRIRRRYLTGQR